MGSGGEEVRHIRALCPCSLIRAQLVFYSGGRRVRVGRCDVREDLWKKQGPEKRTALNPSLRGGKSLPFHWGLFAAAP